MALPRELVVPFVLALTVGVSAPTALGAHLSHRSGGVPFDAALRGALSAVAGAYLVGVGVVWAVAGGPAWGVPAALLAAGALDLLVGAALPLVIGRQVVRFGTGADRTTALRFAAYGWPLAMAVAFGVFVAPGGTGGGDLLSLGGPTVCLVGFCGVPAALAAAVALELLVILVGPGLLGVALHATAREHGRRGG